MNLFGGFKESSDVSDVNKESKPEISQEAQSKFEKIMGDEQLPVANKELHGNKESTLFRSQLLEKFENLFKSDGVRETENTNLLQNSISDVSQGDIKPTRELTEDGKNMLQETLGWTDKQISKCTIDEDGVIHYKTDREDMEGKTGENGITYERKNVDIHGIRVQGVFPVFESVCDVQLSEDLEKASNARQFRECNKQLKENVANDQVLRYSFNEEQLKEIEDGDTPSGYVWHHNEETGKMQLVKVKDHDRTQGGAAHTGGKALWGGGYSEHDV